MYVPQVGLATARLWRWTDLAQICVQYLASTVQQLRAGHGSRGV
jgi:hypothetical protein